MLRHKFLDLKQQEVASAAQALRSFVKSNPSGLREDGKGSRHGEHEVREDGEEGQASEEGEEGKEREEGEEGGEREQGGLVWGTDARECVWWYSRLMVLPEVLEPGGDALLMADSSFRMCGLAQVCMCVFCCTHS